MLLMLMLSNCNASLLNKSIQFLKKKKTLTDLSFKGCVYVRWLEGSKTAHFRDSNLLLFFPLDKAHIIIHNETKKGSVKQKIELLLIS